MTKLTKPPNNQRNRGFISKTGGKIPCGRIAVKTEFMWMENKPQSVADRSDAHFSDGRDGPVTWIGNEERCHYRDTRPLLGYAVE